MDLYEGGDDHIIHSDGCVFDVMLLQQGLILKSSRLVIDRLFCDFIIIGYEMGMLFVTKLLKEFVVLYRAISVEDEFVDCAVRYSRTHHPHHSSPSGTEYLPGDTNLHGVTIRNEAPSVLLQSYQGWGVDVSEGDVHLEEVNIKLVISEEEDSRRNSHSVSPDGVDSVQHQVQLCQVLPSHHHNRLLGRVSETHERSEEVIKNVEKIKIFTSDFQYNFQGFHFQLG